MTIKVRVTAPEGGENSQGRHGSTGNRGSQGQTARASITLPSALSISFHFTKTKNIFSKKSDS